MKKQSEPKGEKCGQTFRDRKPEQVQPQSEQFAPTPAEPIRQHQRMAGVS